MMRPPAWWLNLRRKPAAAPDQSLGWALVHLGVAIKAHQEGDTLRAVRHLALASETISSLIEQWTGVRITEEELEEEAEAHGA